MGRRARKRGTIGHRLLMTSAARPAVPEPEISGEPRPVRVAVGAPVAERAWILDKWWACLAKQILQPDEICFVYSKSQDETFEKLSWPGPWRTHVRQSKLPYHSRSERNANKKDPWRAQHMAKLRNELVTMFMKTDCDVFVSLDTDILLGPTVIERLVDTLYGPRKADPRAALDWDLVAPVVYLHPWGAESECYNAGWFSGGDPGDFDRPWHRAAKNDVIARRSPIPIQIPMACYAISRHAMGMCRYEAHAQGEDIGFAQSLERHKMRCGWRTDIVADHVWDPGFLEAAWSISPSMKLAR